MRSWEDLKNAVLSHMSPEAKARHIGYCEGFQHAFEVWDEELAGASLLHLLRLRRQTGRREAVRLGATNKETS